MTATRRPSGSYAPWIAAALVYFGFSLFVLLRLDYFNWGDDEAVFVLTARAVQQGHSLYGDVWFNYPPGFIQLLRVAFSVGGYSLRSARLAVFALSSVGLVFVTALARGLGSMLAGVSAMTLLATAPHFLANSAAVMTEIPVAALATGAVFAAICYYRSGRWTWLGVSGIALAASLWLKPAGLPIAVVPLIAVYMRESTTRRRIMAGGMLLVFTMLPLAIGFLSSDSAGFFHQFALTYLRSKAAFDLDLQNNAEQMVEYFIWRDKYSLTHLSLVLLGAFGWNALWSERRGEAVLLGSWPVAMGVTLLFHAPLYRHHLLLLLFPVCVLAGVGLDRSVGVLRRRIRGRNTVWFGALLAFAAIEIALSLWVDIVCLPGIESEGFPAKREAVESIRRATASDDYLVTDSGIIALRAGRPVPPELTNTSRMRIQTEQLTDQQVIDITRRAQPGAIVFWENKLDSLDDFATWVACQYDLTDWYASRRRIYQPRRAISPEDIDHPLDVAFGSHIRLMGYSLGPYSLEEGHVIDLTLFWEALAPPEGDYTVFVHLLDGKGERVGQDDSVPRGGRCPTWIWQSGEIVADQHGVVMRRTGAGGPYRFLVGLYDAATGQRLPPDHVLLGELPNVNRRSGDLEGN